MRQAQRAKRAPRLGLTQGRREQAISLYRALGVYAHVAKEMGVSERQFLQWRQDNPGFQAELTAMKEELVWELGEKSAHRLSEYLDSIGTMVPVSEKDTHDSKGQPHTEVHREVVRLHPGLLKFGLTKYDPDLVRAPLTKEEKDEVASFISEVLARRTPEKV